MTRFLCIVLIICAVFACAVSSAGTEPASVTADGTTEELTETAPETETDGSYETARRLLRADLYVFAAAVALFAVCTVIHFVLRSKKKKAEGAETRQKNISKTP